MDKLETLLNFIDDIYLDWCYVEPLLDNVNVCKGMHITVKGEGFFVLSVSINLELKIRSILLRHNSYYDYC